MRYADKRSSNLSDSTLTLMWEKQRGQGNFGLCNFKKEHTNDMWKGDGVCVK